MKLKKVMILLGTVCILNTMVTGCGSGSIAKTEENHISAPKPTNHINQSISQEGKDHE